MRLSFSQSAQGFLYPLSLSIFSIFVLDNWGIQFKSKESEFSRRTAFRIVTLGLDFKIQATVEGMEGVEFGGLN